MLPPRIPKKAKRESRWRSPAHLTWIRGFTCCVCGSDIKIEAAHVRLGSNTGLGQKPDDWRAVPLCGATACGSLGCHPQQHYVGESTFWKTAKIDPEAMIAAFIKASPKRAEIERVMKERNDGRF